MNILLFHLACMGIIISIFLTEDMVFNRRKVRRIKSRYPQLTPEQQN